MTLVSKKLVCLKRNVVDRVWSQLLHERVEMLVKVQMVQQSFEHEPFTDGLCIQLVDNSMSIVKIKSATLDSH